MNLARAIKYRTGALLLLEGDIVNPGGSMTGGGARKSKSILSRKDELTTMRHQLEDYLRQTESFEQQFKELKIKSDQLSELYFEKSQKHNTLKEQSASFEMELDRLTTQETQIKNDHEEFEFEKNDGYTSDKSRQTLSEKRNSFKVLKHL